MSQPEPRNPFYFLLLLASLAFVATALAVTLVPVLEDKAAQAGNPAPPSPFRDQLRGTGALTWLFWELGAMVLFGVLSMGLDRLRSLQKERDEARMRASGEQPPPP